MAPFGAVGLLRGIDRVVAAAADDDVLAPFAAVGGLAAIWITHAADTCHRSCRCRVPPMIMLLPPVEPSAPTGALP